VQLLQQPDKITMLYDEDHEVRRVRMNEPHPEQVTPSWYGDSVGHYEGDTLVIDTVGFKIGLFSAVDQYGTPFTQALHVVERYRLIDYEAARAAWERGGKENSRAGQGIGEGWAPDSTNKGKGLQLQFTVEDKEVFTTPWSATKTYRRVFRDWPEQVCAENPHKYGTEKDAAVPTADKPGSRERKDIPPSCVRESCVVRGANNEDEYTFRNAAIDDGEPPLWVNRYRS
jgi:hypothetical protein